MQSPIIVFDHVNKAATTIQPGPEADKKLAEIAAAQQKQATDTHGRPQHD